MRAIAQRSARFPHRVAAKVVAWALAAMTLLAFARSASASAPVQVLALYSDDAFEQAHALTVALKNAVRHSSSFSLEDGDYSLEVLALALGCVQPPDRDCQQQIANKIGSKRFIWGTMSLKGNDVVAYLNLWEDGSVTRQTRLSYTSNLTTAADDSLRLIASRGLNELTAPGKAKRAREGLLVVTAGNVDGVIFVDDELAGRIHNGYAELMVPVGRRHVAVEARGYERSHGSVIVHGDGPTDLALDPERLGQDFASESYGGTREWEEDEREATSRNSTSGAWAAIGIGAVMIGGGVYSVAQVRKVDGDPGYLRYREGLRPDQNACIEAGHGTQVPGAASPSQVTNLCDRSRTFEALEYVFFGLGSVSAGAGIIMLLSGGSSSDEEKTSSSKLMPSVTLEPGGARVHVSLSF